jgi:hypothetical protein
MITRAMMCALLLVTIPVNLHAQSLTLACDGKMNTGGDHSESIQNMGIVVDLTASAVSGFGGIVARVTRVDSASVSFEGRGEVPALGLTMQVSVWGESPAQ